MTTLLLDTHTLLYAVDDVDSLGPAAREALESKENVLVVSAVSAFEIATKLRIGKLPRAAHLLPGYKEATSRLGRELPVDARHAFAAGSMAWAHKDPFDRLLAAQAIVEGMTLVTDDAELIALDGLKTLW